MNIGLDERLRQLTSKFTIIQILHTASPIFFYRIFANNSIKILFLFENVVVQNTNPSVHCKVVYIIKKTSKNNDDWGDP